MSDFVSLLQSALPNYLRDLEAMVNTDCGTHNKAGVDAIARLARERALAFGAEVIDFPQTQYGNMLYARWRGKGTARIVMVGHMDTVYSDGKTKEFPYRRVAGKAMGCGVIDMKSGLLNGVYAAHALVQSGFENFGEIGFFFNSEEEVGSPVAKEIYPQFVRGANAALILEGARESGAIVSARKGVGDYYVTVQGKPAHAGVEPQKGANAIYTLAEHITALKKLNGFRPNLTVNVGVIRGGTKSNVVPETAEAHIDVRFPQASDVAPFEQAVREIIAREIVSGTKTELSGGLKNPPMEKTEANTRLVGFAKAAASELGFPLEDVMTGGGSDGNYTASLGTPTLDGLGPQGGNGHNAMEEYLLVETIVPRAAMLAKIMVAIANGGSMLV